MPDFGFIGPAYTTASIYQNDSELINWYPEIDPTKAPGDRGAIALYPTPGYIAKGFVGSEVEIRGLWVAPGGGTCYAVASNQLWRGDSTFHGSPVATLGTSSGVVSMTDNGQSLFIADGVNRYAYNFTTGAFQVLADGAFAGADFVDVCDNFVVYNKPNSNLWGATDAGSIASNALSFARKDSAPDNIVALIVSKREVFLLGEYTSEVWVDAGLFPFPFQRLPGTNMQHGCAAKRSVARLGESFAFLAKDDRGSRIVVRMDGYTPVRISTHAVEHDMSTYSTVTDAIGWSYQQEGHEFYVLTFPTADKTWVFDLATGFWHKRASRDALNVYHRDRANCAAVFQGFNLVGDYERGLVYAASLSTYTDYSDIGNVIPRVRRCRHLTEDLKRVFYHDFQIQFQPGVGLQTGQGSDPQAMLRWSDDGGSTWSNEHWTSIGKVGQYKNRARWQRLGCARDRIFEVTVTDPVYAVVVSANANFSAGAT